VKLTSLLLIFTGTTDRSPAHGLVLVRATVLNCGALPSLAAQWLVCFSSKGGGVAEVVRCCVRDGSPKGTCSFLYAACWRAWRAMGGNRLITYTLQSESGASLRGAGWRVVAQLAPSDPKQWQSRPGREWQPVVGQAKIRWEMES
jgi:hypothetical protein